MTIAHRTLAVLAAAAAAVSLGACSKVLDSDDMQTKLGEGFAEETGLAVSEVEVSCPEDPEIEKGKQFDCDVTGPKGTGVANVTLTDDEGTFSWEMSPAELKKTGATAK